MHIVRLVDAEIKEALNLYFIMWKPWRDHGLLAGLITTLGLVDVSHVTTFFIQRKPFQFYMKISFKRNAFCTRVAARFLVHGFCRVSHVLLMSKWAPLGLLVSSHSLRHASVRTDSSNFPWGVNEFACVCVMPCNGLGLIPSFFGINELINECCF